MRAGVLLSVTIAEWMMLRLRPAALAGRTDIGAVHPADAVIAGSPAMRRRWIPSPAATAAQLAGNSQHNACPAVVSPAISILGNNRTNSSPPSRNNRSVRRELFHTSRASSTSAITFSMPEAVIDALEMIDIQQQQPQGAVATVIGGAISISFISVRRLPCRSADIIGQLLQPALLRGTGEHVGEHEQTRLVAATGSGAGHHEHPGKQPP